MREARPAARRCAGTHIVDFAYGGSCATFQRWADRAHLTGLRQGDHDDQVHDAPDKDSDPKRTVRRFTGVNIPGRCRSASSGLGAYESR
jgi:hypothetical protein